MIPADAAGAFLGDTLAAAAKVANGLSRSAGLGVEVPERYDSAAPVLGPLAEHSPRATLAGVILAVGLTLGLAGYALLTLGQRQLARRSVIPVPPGPAPAKESGSAPPLKAALTTAGRGAPAGGEGWL